MADEKKKVNGGVIAAICAVVVAIIVTVVVIVLSMSKGGIVGKYSLISTIDSGGNEIDAKIASNMMDYTIELKEDKTGTMVMKIDMSAYSDYVEDPSKLKSETTLDLTYDDKKIKVTYDGIESEVDYDFKDGILTMEYQGQKLKFKKN